jgi:putative ABC transport system ATP-binding protein
MKVRVSRLTVEYRSGSYAVRPVENLSFSTKSGELVLLLGPSGCGKTTLLSCLGGILRPTSGSIIAGDTEVTTADGADLERYRRHVVGVVFQSFNLIASLSALENVDTPLLAAGVNKRTARERASSLLADVGLEHRMQHRPGDLSGGEQQRVALARALAHDPPLVLADEPTAHLDQVQVDVVLRLLRGLARPGRTVIVSTHDARLVPLADRVVDLAPKNTRRRNGVARLTELARGQVLFDEGSFGEHIYLVEKGKVDVVRSDEEVLASYGPGEYFGELGPLLGFPRAGTARAAERSVVHALTVPGVQEADREQPPARPDPSVSLILPSCRRRRGASPSTRGIRATRRRPV